MNQLDKTFKDLDAKVSKRIREIRIKRDVQQEKLAKYVGVSKQAISKIEHGKRKVGIDELEKIALFFNIPIDYFVKDDYKYNYPLEFEDKSYPVYISEFLYEIEKGLSTNPGKDNFTYRSIDNLIKELNYLKKTVTEHRLSQKKQL